MVEEFAVKYPYLFNYTTEVERKALCEACEDDEDTLMEWDDQARRYERGEFVRSDFVIALHESIDAEENALLEYAKDIRNLFCLKTRLEDFLNYFACIL